MLALVIRVVSHQKVGVFSMQEAEAINSQVEGIESKMDGSFPLLMENVLWFQSGGARLLAAPLSGPAFQCPPRRSATALESDRHSPKEQWP